MGYDAMANDASVPSNPRDTVKKKRTNRSAKLKQCKLDARREQWLSQVKDRGFKATTAMGSSPTSPPPHNSLSWRCAAAARDGLGAHNNDTESPAHSPTPSTSCKAPRKSCPNNSTSSGSSIGSSCSRSVSDAEEEEKESGEEKGGALDDWEAIADALYADGEHTNHPDPDPLVAAADSKSIPGPRNDDRPGGTEKPDHGRSIPRAWRPDDVFRPQSLPNLSKQRSFPVSMERHYGAVGWADHGILPTPTSCPICYEELDLTDSSFRPCSCGFHLCLFCHKRILEADGRCPGCRKQYSSLQGCETGIGGGVMPFSYQLSRSCSMRSGS